MVELVRNQLISVNKVLFQPFDPSSIRNSPNENVPTQYH